MEYVFPLLVCPYCDLKPPVEPKPPLPRSVSSSESTSSISGVEIFSMISCAMRSPAWTALERRRTLEVLGPKVEQHDTKQTAIVGIHDTSTSVDSVLHSYVSTLVTYRDHCEEPRGRSVLPVVRSRCPSAPRHGRPWESAHPHRHTGRTQRPGYFRAWESSPGGTQGCDAQEGEPTT